MSWRKVGGEWRSSGHRTDEQRRNEQAYESLRATLEDHPCVAASSDTPCTGTLVIEPWGGDRQAAGYDPNRWARVCTGHRQAHVTAHPAKVPLGDQPTPATQEDPPMSNLGQFDGKDVIRTTIAVTNAGDGLSSAMKVDPQLFHLGEKVFVVLECEVANVKFVPLPTDDQLLNRVHTLRAGGATIVEADLVQDHLAAQAQRILKAKEAAEGYTEGNLVDAAEAAEREAAASDPEHPGYGEPAGEDFEPSGKVTAPAKVVDGEQFTEDADGFAEPAHGADKDAAGLKDALLGATPGASNVVDIGSATAKPAAKRPAKKAPAKKPAARKTPAAKKPAARKATK